MRSAGSGFRKFNVTFFNIKFFLNLSKFLDDFQESID